MKKLCQAGAAMLAVFYAAIGHSSEVLEWSAFKRADSSLVVFESVQSVSVEAGDYLQLKTKSGKAFQVQVERVRRTSLGNYSISGKTAAGGVFTSVIGPSGTVLGSLSEGYDNYRLSSDNGKSFFQRQDPSVRPQAIDSGAAHPREFGSAADAELTVSNIAEPSDYLQRRLATGDSVAKTTAGQAEYPVYKADSTIDILIYYDDDLANPFEVIDYVIEYSNYIYDFSEMGMELRVADAISRDIDSAINNTALLAAMKAADPPFSQIEADRSNARADLVHTIRAKEADDSDYNCGWTSYSVYLGNSYRRSINGVTEWLPRQSGRFCPDWIFTHEIGHNLGGNHHRDDYSADTLANGTGAYFYSFGSYRAGVYSTIMSEDEGRFDNPYLTFSTPLLTCDGVPCGVAPSERDSADNRRTFMNTKHLVAAYNGSDFDHAAIQNKPRYSSCSDGKPFRGLNIRNNSQYSLEVMSRTFLRADGSSYFTGAYDEGEFILPAGDNLSRGYCREEDEQPFGSEITEAFFTYKNPETGEEVEGTHIFFDDDYEGDYGIVRAAAGVGGSVVGHPSIHARVDAEVEILFEPDYGYKLDEVTGTCPGSLHYNIYTAEPLYGDCWAVASFRPLESQERVQQHFNNLLDTV
ncbi:M12 family metallo-peptidase, partial [Luminiphilus sp.]|nr:M12 family metallo-peptidase [Luminiphilus sp.]